MNKIWRLKTPSSKAFALSQNSGISPLLSQLLVNRGIIDSSSALNFLKPTLSDLLDPFLLKDMDKAVDLIIKSIEKKEKVMIFGDFDADGITATTLLTGFFSELGIPVGYYIPNRIQEGYGLHIDSIKKISKQDYRLIITVDCGISNMSEVEFAIEQGMNVVVTDHHQFPEGFKPICPVVNPHRSDSIYPFRELAGVGVAFCLAVALRARLRESGWFKKSREPDLKKYLELVALGTVADIVPLMDQNRILVKAGLNMMMTDQGLGLEAIRSASGIDKDYIQSSDLAFKIAPRLNATGRISDPEIGVRALLTAKEDEAKSLASHLNDLNRRRQRIESDIISEIEGKINQNEIRNRKTLFFSGEGWHRGVLGIVASKLSEKYYRPVLVVGIENGIAVGSGRSIEGFNLYEALSSLSSLLVRFGGHEHAAGLTIDTKNIGLISDQLEEIGARLLNEEILSPSIDIDAEFKLQDVTTEAIEGIETLAPFGQKNREPLFYASRLEVVSSVLIKGKHLKLRLRQDGEVRDAFGFNLSEYHYLEGQEVNAIFTPEINRWRGRERIQLKIQDLEKAGTGSSKLRIIQ